MIRLLLFVFFLFTCHSASARDMESFELIPIAHEGRIKPLDSFARATLKSLSGRESIEDHTASEFLAETLFNPAEGIKLPVFKIENAALRHQFGLSEKERFFYSLEDILPGLKKTSAGVTALLKTGRKKFARDEQALLALHEKALSFTSLLRSLSLLLPLNVDLPEKYNRHKDTELSYLDLKKLEQDLSSDLKFIIRQKGDEFEKYTVDEKRVAIASYQLEILAAAASGNAILKIIPPQWNSENGDWHAPWELLQSGEGSPSSAKLLNIWRDMGRAYQNTNKDWHVASAKVLQISLEQAPQIDRWKLKLEIFQNRFPPILLSLIAYALSFSVILSYLIFRKSPLQTASALLLTGGAGIHLFGLFTRIILLDRPPVGTLYESIIFVSLAAVLISLLLEKFLKNSAGILTGSLAGTILGLVALSFAGNGDTMEMLTAVLNTNFWLATHVLCITLGYGWCILTSILAHIALASRKFNLPHFNTPQSEHALYMLAILALLFTTIGTILGGIWADQSWGRFWGWDPKENGALLIVLWLVWALHGKLGNQLKETGFLASLAFLNIIVAISWIGVNLLGVGLHSYGFTDGLFYSFALFLAFETMLIIFLSVKRHA